MIPELSDEEETLPPPTSNDSTRIISEVNQRNCELILPRHTTSYVWKYFRKYPIPLDQNIRVCLLCYDEWVRDLQAPVSKWEVYIDKSNTSHMDGHLFSHHLSIWETHEIDRLNSKKVKNGSPSQSKLIDSQQAECRELFFRWMVFDNQEFSTCDSKHFQNFAKAMNPHFSIEDGYRFTKYVASRGLVSLIIQLISYLLLFIGPYRRYKKNCKR